jgi:hypothetical protein
VRVPAGGASTVEEFFLAATRTDLVRRSHLRLSAGPDVNASAAVGKTSACARRAITGKKTQGRKNRQIFTCLVPYKVISRIFILCVCFVRTR